MGRTLSFCLVILKYRLPGEGARNLATLLLDGAMNDQFDAFRSAICITF